MSTHKTIALFFVFALLNSLFAQLPQYVWFDQSGQGRQQYGVFHKQFEINTLTEQAWICLFADTRYQLMINGEYINFGPARFYPQNPMYDSLNIAPFLQKGTNILVVKVLSNGVATFQHVKNIGGFIAWGKVISQNKTIADFTTPGDWTCQRDEGFDPTSPRLSFALHIMESFDASKGLNVWKQKPIITGKPFVLTNQNAWGTLKPRNIPMMNHKEVKPKKLLGVYSLQNTEQIYSFRIKTADSTREVYNQNPRAFAYTYIYSPKDQNISAGMWWGEFWLNGSGPLKGKGFDGVRPQRSDIDLNLKKGWNFFFVKYGIVWAYWDFYMAVPKDANLVFSPEQKMESTIGFRSSGPYYKDRNPDIFSLSLPFTKPDDLPKNSLGWTDRPKNLTAGNPAWEMAWSYFDKKLDYDPNLVHDITLADKSGNALVFDMGNTQMGNFFMEFEAPKGTIVDVGFTEDTLGNRPHVLKRTELMLSARYIATEGTNRYLTFNPYGTKFIQINIHGNNGQPVHIKRLGMINQLYPYDLTGSFECSDPMFNDIWKLGARTLQVCSEDSYTDTPVRERGLYAGDAFPEYAITLATSGDSRLVMRSLELFQDMYADVFKDSTYFGFKNELSDFPVLTTLYFEWYYLQTNDIEFVRKLYPKYKNMLLSLRQNMEPNGLIKTNTVFIEWTKITKQNYSSTAFNAFAVAANFAMARLAKAIGENQDVTVFNNMGNQLKNSIHQNCWDESKGAFCDGIKDGIKLNSHYPISSCLMTLFGLTNPDQEMKLTTFYNQNLKDIGDRDRAGMSTPYGGFYTLGAMFLKEQTGLAENYIRKYWGPMVLKYNNNVWENFDSDGPQGTMSHAWSGSPTYYLTTQCLGVNLGFPNQSTNINQIIISPQSESVTWARGSVPHPKGKIEVEWSIKGNVLFVDYKVPKGLQVEIKPKGKLSTLKLIVQNKSVD